jgi:hypothetical protein
LVEIEDDDGDFEKKLKSFRFKNVLTAQEILLTKLQEGLNNNLTIEEIVEDWLYSPIDGVVDEKHSEY